MIMLNSNHLHSAADANLAGLKLHRSSLHKDIYDFGDSLLIVAKDQVLDPDTYKLEMVPNKGLVATRQSRYWFQQLSEYCPNHYISGDIDAFPAPCSRYAGYLRGRSMLVKKMAPIPIKFIVIGYLQGVFWLEYQETGKVAGNLLPRGMKQAERLPSPICVPMLDVSAGIEEDSFLQDENSKLFAETLCDMAKKLYLNAWKMVRKREVLLVSTTFRFGLFEDRPHLIGECITPDSSRFASPGACNSGSPPCAGKDILFQHNNCSTEKNHFKNSREDCFEKLCADLTEPL